MQLIHFSMQKYRNWGTLCCMEYRYMERLLTCHVNESLPGPLKKIVVEGFIVIPGIVVRRFHCIWIRLKWVIFVSNLLQVILAVTGKMFMNLFNLLVWKFCNKMSCWGKRIVKIVLKEEIVFFSDGVRQLDSIWVLKKFIFSSREVLCFPCNRKTFVAKV